MVLIELHKSIINAVETQTTNARELHKFIESKREFATWITNRIQKYGFVENVDYLKTSRKVGNATAYDYHITLDMAKELCMVENNEKGREARRYFIECEKNLQIGQEQFDRLKETIISQNAQIAQLIKELENKQKKIEYKSEIKRPAYSHLLDIIGQIARYTEESEHMEMLMRKRREKISRFLTAFVLSVDNSAITEQANRRSEEIYHQMMKSQK